MNLRTTTAVMEESFSSDSDGITEFSAQAEREDAGRQIFIESYGVKMSLGANSQQAFRIVEAIMRTALPNCFRVIEKTEQVNHRFELFLSDDVEAGNQLLQNDRPVPSDGTQFDVLRGFESQIRLTVAEQAVGRVFAHAGVVGWKGRAIVIPGRSFSGKTSLTAALVKKGAEYLSDEYAVFDEAGFVHPFLKTLSVRGIIDEYTQKEFPVEAFGGRAAREKIPVGMVLITAYKAGAEWRPERLSPGLGVMEMLPHVAPIRYDPKFTFKVLKQVAKRAIITKTYRDDTARSADLVLDLFESVCLKN